MQLPVHGHPLHTRSLTLVVTQREAGRWHARGDVIDLRKVGFVPMMGDIQPAGIIHGMSIELGVDPVRATIESLDVAQPFVAIEPSPRWQGECCRDPAPRLSALVGERIDDGFVRRLGRVFGGPLGCSHLLTLFQLMAGGLRQAFALEAALPEGARSRRAPGERPFRRAVSVEGFDAGDDVVQMAVQLADFHTRPDAPEHAPVDRLAGEWDVRLFGEVGGPERRIAGLRLADRYRTAADLADAPWRDHGERIASLAGAPVMGGLARRIFETFAEPGDDRLRDTALQLAPGFIQVMAAFMDRWLGRGGGPAAAAGGPVGGTVDSCYMWRSDGPMLRLRGDGAMLRLPGDGDGPD